MKIIISPAMTMKVDNDIFHHRQLPVFIEETEKIVEYLQRLSYQELKAMWKASDKLSRLNQERIEEMNIYKNLSPAILAYEGIQYKYMAPGIFSYESLDYLEEHLRILSGFYGILSPFDGVVPHRLEMKSKTENWNYKSIEEFWNSKIAEELFSQTRTIINLASKEYSQVISKYLPKEISFINLHFGQLIDGKMVERSALLKMARGEMVRFMAENLIQDLDQLKSFDGLGFAFSSKLSDHNKIVFLKED